MQSNQWAGQFFNDAIMWSPMGVSHYCISEPLILIIQMFISAGNIIQKMKVVSPQFNLQGATIKNTQPRHTLLLGHTFLICWVTSHQLNFQIDDREKQLAWQDRCTVTYRKFQILGNIWKWTLCNYICKEFWQINKIKVFLVMQKHTLDRHFSPICLQTNFFYESQFSDRRVA